MHNSHQVLDSIQQALEGRRSGHLLLERGKESIKLFCHNGRITAASSNLVRYQLGQLLRKRGAADAAFLDRLLRGSRIRRVPLGKTAVRKKLLNSAELAEVVRSQVIELMTYVLECGNFEVRGFTNSSRSFPVPAGLDYDHLILDLARANLDPLPLQNGQRLVMAASRGRLNLSWYPHEIHVLSELRTPRTLQELAAATALDNGRLGKILSVLNSLRLIAIVGNGMEAPAAAVPPTRFPFEMHSGKLPLSLIPEVDASAVSERVEVLRDESTFISEQFKTLKVRIRKVSRGNQATTITITSAEAEDGKSLVCANLALSFSRDIGRRVLLVDCDLRNPSVHKYLGISPEPGLLGYLRSEGLNVGCFMRRLGNLYILTSGGVADNPVEMLMHDKMSGLIKYLETEFDTVLLDAPPLAPISDAHILVGLSGGVIVVLRSGRTPYSSVRAGFRGLDRSKLLGLVLNDVKPMRFNTQYPYKYYHYRYRDHYRYAAQPSLPTDSRPKPYFDTE